MGKASKWFRGLLGLRRADSPSATAPKEKRRWSFVKSYREKDRNATVQHHSSDSEHIPDIAGEEYAAIKIQAAFRGYLARKALRALKGLVKLQALVRGHIERKRTAEWLQRVQALLRVQAQIRAARAQIFHSPYSNAKSSSLAHLYGPATPDKFESPIRSESMKYDQSPSVLKRNSSKSRIHNGNQEKSGNRSESRVEEPPWNQRRSWTRACSMDEERSLRILELDSVKPHMTSKRRNLFYSPSQDLVSDHHNQFNGVEDAGDSYSPKTLSASSKDGGPKIGPLTPTRSDGSRSYLSGYSECEYPSYMAYTESSKAKVRSLSAPKQRPQYERSTSSNRYSLHAFAEPKLASQREKVSALHANFTSKAYPGSGRLDKLGLPVGYRY
uniref:Protein IQ-DOMAIN 14 n=1 Tax=Cajanus cajan TaxID=3821 RepID=A0A151TJR5_CAJCA|nr:Protein IQ-DOMAIN 14 [Cajanus cajan]